MSNEELKETIEKANYLIAERARYEELISKYNHEKEVVENSNDPVWNHLTDGCYNVRHLCVIAFDSMTAKANEIIARINSEISEIIKPSPPTPPQRPEPRDIGSGIFISIPTNWISDAIRKFEKD